MNIPSNENTPSLDGPHLLVPNTNPEKVLDDTNKYAENVIRTTINQIIEKEQPKLRGVFINSFSSYFPEDEKLDEKIKPFRETLQNALFDYYTSVANEYIEKNRVRYKIQLLNKVASTIHGKYNTPSQKILDSLGLQTNNGIGPTDITVNMNGGSMQDAIMSKVSETAMSKLSGISGMPKSNTGNVGAMNAEDEIKFKYPLYYLEMYSKNVTMKSVQYMMYNGIHKTVMSSISKHEQKLLNGEMMAPKTFDVSPTSSASTNNPPKTDNKSSNIMSSALDTLTEGADLADTALNIASSLPILGGESMGNIIKNKLTKNAMDTMKKFGNNATKKMRTVLNTTKKNIPKDEIVPSPTNTNQDNSPHSDAEMTTKGLRELCDSIFNHVFVNAIQSEITTKTLWVLLVALVKDPDEQFQNNIAKAIQTTNPKSFLENLAGVQYVELTTGGNSDGKDNTDLLNEIAKFMDNEEFVKQLDTIVQKQHETVDDNDIGKYFADVSSDNGNDPNLLNKISDVSSDNSDDPNLLNEISDVMDDKDFVNELASIIQNHETADDSRINVQPPEKSKSKKSVPVPPPSSLQPPETVSSGLNTSPDSIKVPRRLRVVKLVTIILDNMIKTLKMWVSKDKKATTQEIVKYIYKYIRKFVTINSVEDNGRYLKMTTVLADKLMNGFSANTHRAFFNIILFGNSKYLKSWNDSIITHMKKHTDFEPTSLFSRMFYTVSPQVDSLYNDCVRLINPLQVNVKRMMDDNDLKYKINPDVATIQYPPASGNNPPIHKLIFDVIDFKYDPEKDKTGSKYSMLYDETPLSVMSHRVINHNFIGLIEDIYKNACSDSTDYILPIILNNALERFAMISMYIEKQSSSQFQNPFSQELFYKMVFDSKSNQDLLKHTMMGFLYEMLQAVQREFGKSKQLISPKGENAPYIANFLLFCMYYNEHVYHNSKQIAKLSDFGGNVDFIMDTSESAKKQFHDCYKEFKSLLGEDVTEDTINNFADEYNTTMNIINRKTLSPQKQK